MSGTCDRFETEGLLQLERGEALDPHFETCPDCLAARRLYARLVDELATVDEAVEPPAGWRERVRERVAEAPPRADRGGWPILLAALVAIAAGLGFWLRTADAPPTGLTVEITAGDSTYRGDRAQPGDRLHLVGPTDRDHVELRVYRDDRVLVLRCADQAPCRRSDSTVEADLVLDDRGLYRPVLLRSAKSLPQPTGEGLDVDLERAADSGATFELGEEIEVR